MKTAEMSRSRWEVFSGSVRRARVTEESTPPDMATMTVRHHRKALAGSLADCGIVLTFIALPKSAICIAQPGLLANSYRQIDAITETSSLAVHRSERGGNRRIPSGLR